MRTILASIVALALNGVLLLVQALVLRETEPLSDSAFLSVAVPLFLLLCWFMLGFLLMKGLRRTNGRAELVFLVPPVLFTGVLLGLHIAFPPNEFLSVFLNLWFITVGYFLGGFVAWRRVRSA
jgi:hypothetical protein